MIGEERITFISKELKEDQAILDERLEALRKSKELAMPSFKEGLSVSVDGSRIPSKLEDHEYHKLEINNIDEYKGVRVVPFSLASAEEKKLLREKRYSLVSASKDKLVSLHKATCFNGLLIMVEENAICDEVIRIDRAIEKYGFDHVVVIAKKNSRAHFKRVLVDDCKTFAADVIEIFVEDGAQLIYNEVQTLSKESVWCAQRGVHVGKGAKAYLYTHVLGGHLSKNETVTKLACEDSEVINLVTSKLGDDQHADFVVKNMHKSKKTSSGMYAKSVVDDDARLLYRGLVYIGDEASDASGYQQEDVLLLGEKAQADAIPELQINNGQVSCSHGATVGKVDPLALFYLQSRGLDEKKAQQMITAGFLASILDYVTDDLWKDEIISILEGY